MSFRQATPVLAVALVGCESALEGRVTSVETQLAASPGGLDDVATRLAALEEWKATVDDDLVALRTDLDALTAGVNGADGVVERLAEVEALVDADLDPTLLGERLDELDAALLALESEIDPDGSDLASSRLDEAIGYESRISLLELEVDPDGTGYMGTRIDILEDELTREGSSDLGSRFDEFVKPSDLTQYATQSWVQSAGYATQTFVTTRGYATESYVDANFATFDDLDDAVAPYGGFEVVDVDRTLSVGPTGDYDTLLAALDDVNQWRILPGARVTIELRSGLHSFGRSVEFNHPDGARVSIIGTGAQAADTILDFPGGHSGFVIANATLGELDNVKVRGVSTQGGWGLHLTNGRATLGTVEVEGFAGGVYALGSVVNLDHLEVHHNPGLGNAGLLVGNGSTVIGGRVLSHHNHNGVVIEGGRLEAYSTSLAQSNLVVEDNTVNGVSIGSGGVLRGGYARIRRNVYGLAVQWNSIAEVGYSEITDNTYLGVYSTGFSYVDLQRVVVTRNARGVETRYGGTVYTDGVTSVTGNTIAQYLPGQLVNISDIGWYQREFAR